MHVRPTHTTLLLYALRSAHARHAHLRKRRMRELMVATPMLFRVQKQQQQQQQQQKQGSRCCWSVEYRSWVAGGLRLQEVGAAGC